MSDIEEKTEGSVVLESVVSEAPRTPTLEEIRRAGIPESWNCIDCGMNTAPGFPNAAQVAKAFAELGSAPVNLDERSEIYWVKPAVWRAAGSAAGCLCVGCIEKRLGRTLRPKDFDETNELNWFPGTDRLFCRQMGLQLPLDDSEDVVCESRKTGKVRTAVERKVERVGNARKESLQGAFAKIGHNGD